MNTGRVVGITGASGGVGSALVHAFLANDDLVVAQHGASGLLEPTLLPLQQDDYSVS